MSTVEIPINTAVEPEIEQEIFFGDEEPVIEEDGFFAEVNDQPIGISVRYLFELLKQPMPTELLLYKRFRAWLVPHGVKIIRRSGNSWIDSAAIRVHYQFPQRATCTTVALFPSARFVNRTTLELHGLLSATGEIGGELHAPPDVLPVTMVGLNFRATGSIATGVHFSATTTTPHISAVGLRSRRCEWRFERVAEDPLFGRDLETWSIVVLPEGRSHLDYEICFSLDIRSSRFYRSKTREAAPITVRCRLEGE